MKSENKELSKLALVIDDRMVKKTYKSVKTYKSEDYLYSSMSPATACEWFDYIESNKITTIKF